MKQQQKQQNKIIYGMAYYFGYTHTILYRWLTKKNYEKLKEKKPKEKELTEKKLKDRYVNYKALELYFKLVEIGYKDELEDKVISVVRKITKSKKDIINPTYQKIGNMVGYNIDTIYRQKTSDKIESNRRYRALRLYWIFTTFLDYNDDMLEDIIKQVREVIPNSGKCLFLK